MAPAAGLETMRKGLAMGAHRGVLVSDPALAGSDHWSTMQVLAAALKTLEYDLVLVGFDTSDGVGGVVGAGLAALLQLPLMSSAAKIEPDVDGGVVRVRRISATGFDVLEAPMPALIVGTQLLGEPRYPSLKGIMAARSKEVVTTSLADLGLDPASIGGAVARPRRDPGRPRHPRRRRKGDRRAAQEPADHLMAGTIWVIAETNADGSLAKSSAEVATLARNLADEAGASAVGILVASSPDQAA